jgi:U3 small nucleolar RNA-associated protein 22
MFFYDSYGGDTIGLVWKPSGFEPKPFTVAESIAAMPSTKTGAEKKKKGKLHIVPNVEQIVNEIREMGQGIVEDIVVNSPPSL